MAALAIQLRNHLVPHCDVNVHQNGSERYGVSAIRPKNLNNADQAELIEILCDAMESARNIGTVSSAHLNVEVIERDEQTNFIHVTYYIALN